MSDELKFPREYPTVPSLDEIDRKDFVALKRARDQQTRERYNVYFLFHVSVQW